MKNNNIIVASTFLWLGFVLAISFLEAWIKFEAPNITIALGLGIGRLVFAALNAVELILMLLITIGLVSSLKFKTHRDNWLFYIPVFIMLLQTVWLLPALDERAEGVIKGTDNVPSNLHFYYIVFEIIKVISLLLFGIKRLKLYSKL